MNTQIEEAAANEQLPVDVENKKQGMPAALRIFLCILLSLLLIADIAVIAATTAVRMNSTKDKIEEIIDNTDYMTIPLTIDNVQSNLYEMFLFAFANSSTDYVDIYGLAEETDFDGFISEQLYSYVSFILYDKRLEGIDSDIIMEFYDKNADKIDSAFNVVHDRNEVSKIIEGQDIIFDKLTNNEIEASIPLIKLIRFAMSPFALVLFSVLAVACIVFIGVLSRSVGTPFVATGISASATGLAGTVISCLSIWGTIGVELTPITSSSVIWQGIVGAVLPDIFTMFVYILTVGILLILTGGFIGQIRRNVKRAKNN
ncbi:MAG: hypothetical protein J6A05_03435 [Oscillospiraceae bacterium]|nr:hypothetical protein [Oscillospiraceae bacterium]